MKIKIIKYFFKGTRIFDWLASIVLMVGGVYYLIKYVTKINDIIFSLLFFFGIPILFLYLTKNKKAGEIIECKRFEVIENA